MSFWDDVKDAAEKVVTVVSAPVWAPAAAFGTLLDKTFPKNQYAGAIANTFEAPASFVVGGKYSVGKLNDAIKQAAPGLQLAGAASGGALGSAVGFDSSGVSLASGVLSDLTGSNNSGAKYNDPYAGAPRAPATPLPQVSQDSGLMVPILLIGGAAVIAVLVSRR